MNVHERVVSESQGQNKHPTLKVMWQQIEFLPCKTESDLFWNVLVVWSEIT